MCSGLIVGWWLWIVGLGLLVVVVPFVMCVLSVCCSWFVVWCSWFGVICRMLCLVGVACWVCCIECRDLAIVACCLLLFDGWLLLCLLVVDRFPLFVDVCFFFV